MAATHFSGPVVVGEGDQTPAPTAGTYQAPDAQGTNIAGGQLNINGGRGTGSGVGGDIVFSTAGPGSSGSDQNALVERGRITDDGLWQMGAAAAAGSPVLVRTLALTPTANANTDLTLAMPACRILRMSQRTTTAYTGATATVAVGSAVGGAQFVAATDIKAKAARRDLTLVDSAADTLDAFPAGDLYVRIAQGTPTAVGAGVLVVEYQPL